MCLHYLLTAIDPVSMARSAWEVVEVRKQLGEGRGFLATGAGALVDVIQDEWTGRAEVTALSDLARRVDQILGPMNQNDPPERLEVIIKL